MAANEEVLFPISLVIPTISGALVAAMSGCGLLVMSGSKLSTPEGKLVFHDGTQWRTITAS